MYSGVYVNEHRLLSPIASRAATTITSEASQKYLRENMLQAAIDIDVKRRTNIITAEEAYNELAKVCIK